MESTVLKEEPNSPVKQEVQLEEQENLEDIDLNTDEINLDYNIKNEKDCKQNCENTADLISVSGENSDFTFINVKQEFDNVPANNIDCDPEDSFRDTMINTVKRQGGKKCTKTKSAKKDKQEQRCSIKIKSKEKNKMSNGCLEKVYSKVQKIKCQRTNQKRAFLQYSEDALKSAIDAIDGGMSRKKASAVFGVPRATIIRRLKKCGECRENFKRKMGPDSVLPKHDEEDLKQWIVVMARKGFPVHRLNIFDTIQMFLNKQGMKTCFKDNRPGRTWFRNFLRRHPEIKEKHSEGLTKMYAEVSNEEILSWFNSVKIYLQENGYYDILRDPLRIFNGDKISFLLCPKSGIVLGPARSQEDFYQQVPNDKKQQITVMAMFSAAGATVPPMIIYPYKKIPHDIAHSVPENFGLGHSDSGWMTSEVFYEYMANHFLKYLELSNITRPVIVFVDGHRTRLTKHVSEFCEMNGIILMALHPNSTHILQLADVSVFKALKSGWKGEVKQWKFENFPKDVTRYTFGSFIAKIFRAYAHEETVKNGFKKCGLYPFTVESIDFSKCVKNRKIKDYHYQSITNSTDKISFSDSHVLKVLEDKIKTNLGDHVLHDFETVLLNGADWEEDMNSKNLFIIWKSIKCDNMMDKSQDSPAFDVTNVGMCNSGLDIDGDLHEDVHVLDIVDVNLEILNEDEVSSI